MSPPHEHQHDDDTDIDWAAMAANLELEAEMMLPYVTEAADAAAGVCREAGITVRRILDIGSGPGVMACELARRFPAATVIAADGAEPLLQRVVARAEEAGLAGRVKTVRVDLPDGVDALGHADLIWMAMVLHHIGDEAAMLRRLVRMLEPRGVLMLAEHGDPLRFLPEGAEPCPPGFIGRLEALEAEWLAAMRADLPGSKPSDVYPAMLESAGFTVAVDRLPHVRSAVPLADAPRRAVLSTLRQMQDLGADRLDAVDRAALDVLIDEGAPLGVMRRDDVVFEASRHVYVATVGS
ncbi:MAG: class I SAM-dependent methyltransferase [Chloroflexota bacterium]